MARTKSPVKKKSKSRVNEAGNYTKPTMRKNLLIKLKQVLKEVVLGNGLDAKRKC